MSATWTRVRPAAAARDIAESPLAAVCAIWLSAAVTSVLAPDLVTGSSQEHLPLGLMTVWLWACVGSGYALMTPQRGSRAGWTLGVTLVWVSTAVVTVTAPLMVTGTDPTQIPLAVVVAPPVATVVTGFLSLRQASRSAP